MEGARKLTLQFGHTSKEKLKRLIEEAYGKNERREAVEGCKRQIKEIYDTCEMCIKLRRKPKKSVVGMQLGKVFNEVVAMDIGELDGEKFLVKINLATPYCQGGD